MSEEYVHLSGSLYRGVPVYVGPRELDLISTMVLRSIAREQRLSQLKNLLDLPQRLVEDIISALIRRRLLLIDTKVWNCILPASVKEQVEQLDSRPPGTPFRTDEAEAAQSEGTVLFWQDGLTGRIIPWDALTRYKTKPYQHGQIYVLRPGTREVLRLPESFSDAELVSTLGPTIGWYSTNKGTEWRLNRIIERRPIGPRSIWLSVRVISDQGRDYRYIVAPPEIPRDIMERWTRALRVASTDKEGPLITSRPPGEEYPRVLGRLDLASCRGAWNGALTVCLEGGMRPTTELLTDLEKATAALEEACRRITRVERIQDAHQQRQHLESMLNLATRYAILVTSSVTPKLVASLSDWLEAAAAKLVDIFLISTAPSSDSQQIREALARIRYADRHLHYLEAPKGLQLRAELIVRDGIEAIVASQPFPDETFTQSADDELPASTIAVHLRGQHVAGQLADVIATHFRDNAAASAQAIAVAQLLAQHTAFGTGKGVADVQVKQFDFTGYADILKKLRDAGRGMTSDLEEPPSGPEVSSQVDWQATKTACELLQRELLQRLDAIDSYASTYSVHVVTGSEHRSLLTEALAQPVGDCLSIVTRTLSRQDFDDEFMELLRRAMKDISVRIHWGSTMSPEEHAAAAQIAADAERRIRDPGFSIQALPANFRGELLMNGALVCISAHNWLASEASGEVQSIGVALVSGTLSHSIRGWLASKLKSGTA